MTMTLEAFPPSIKIGAEDVIKFQEDGTINVKINGTWTSVTVEGNAYDELTEFASQATIGPFGTALAFDTSGNLYWAVSNYYNGTTYNLTSYIYKITPGGTKTTFASQSGFGTASSTLVFGGNNLYWALMNYGESTSPCQNSYIYVKSL